LIVDLRELAANLTVANEKFTQSSCGYQEGFVNTPGPHQLLRFTTATPNIGTADMVMGDPSLCAGLFIFSACHQHYHFDGYADYRLWTEGGYAAWYAGRDLTQPSNIGVNATLLTDAAKSRDLIIGRKQGFCFIDSARYLATAKDTPTYTSCMTNQGISAGWTDRYDYRLEGQYIEIDHLKADIYVLENQVDPDHRLPDLDYTNNTAAIRFRFAPAKGATPAIVEVLGVL